MDEWETCVECQRNCDHSTAKHSRSTNAMRCCDVCSDLSDSRSLVSAIHAIFAVAASHSPVDMTADDPWALCVIEYSFRPNLHARKAPDCWCTSYSSTVDAHAVCCAATVSTHCVARAKRRWVVHRRETRDISVRARETSSRSDSIACPFAGRRRSVRLNEAPVDHSRPCANRHWAHVHETLSPMDAPASSPTLAWASQRCARVQSTWDVDRWAGQCRDLFGQDGYDRLFADRDYCLCDLTRHSMCHLSHHRRRPPQPDGHCSCRRRTTRTMVRSSMSR